SPPTDPAELTALQTARQSIVAERDRAFQLLESVRQCRAHAYARGWSDAQRRLKESGGLVPALEGVHAASILRREERQQQLALAEQAWEERTALAQKASGEVVALQAHISRAETELEAEGLLVLTLPEQQQRLADLNRQCERLDAECTALRVSAQNKAAEAARLDERRNQANEEEKRVTALQARVQDREQPARKAWEAL